MDGCTTCLLYGSENYAEHAVLCLIAQSCPTLCHPMDYNPPGSSVLGDSPGKNTGVGCHAFLQQIFPAQGLNPGLSRCRQILYHLSLQGSPLQSPGGGNRQTSYKISGWLFPEIKWILPKLRAINWVTPVPQNIRNNPQRILKSIRKFSP